MVALLKLHTTRSPLVISPRGRRSNHQAIGILVAVSRIHGRADHRNRGAGGRRQPRSKGWAVTVTLADADLVPPVPVQLSV